MGNNVSVLYNGGFLPGIILLTQCYYHRGTRLRVPYTQYGFLSRVACFWSCSCLQKRFIVFPGLPLALLFYARASIGRTDGA